MQIAIQICKTFVLKDEKIFGKKLQQNKNGHNSTLVGSGGKYVLYGNFLNCHQIKPNHN